MTGRTGRLPLLLGLLAVLLAVFGFYALQRAGDLRSGDVVKNAALTDNAGTSEVKGEVGTLLAKVFSYGYTDPSKTDTAARSGLTGKATGQYDALFKSVRTQGPAEKLVLTTTVTDSAVTSLRDDRASLLVFATQRDTRATDGKSSTVPTMLAIDAVRQKGHWKISAINTLTS
ncbi:hypothetical protein BTM25_18090 [Actinomadura rubteroloni]|uniref:Mce-associated membrane protein n=1 Tax=Actinomadura rubteroloni TaxID=1926885 RepID=A0A2P4UQS0_9ACTN|nr:hypothetical protein [Actinomadura rubteroloni]POM27395.1 hypothetical protein BTM25_18090 [Actinomadura rubteroloni]